MEYMEGKMQDRYDAYQHEVEAHNDALATGWAMSRAWHHYGIAWKHLERVSQLELLAEARQDIESKA